jgi:hypothetical protein
MTRLPKNFDIFELSGCFIAGGAILSIATKNDINDYDIYPKNFEGFKQVLTKLSESFNATIVNISERAITYKCIIDSKFVTAQVMLFDWFDTANKIFDYFDFTVCMGAYDCDSKKYIFHEEFYPDIASKTLRFNHNTKYPLGSLIRVQKYTKKGFNIGRFEYAKIALTLSNKEMPKSWNELETQLGGIYGKQVVLESDGIEYNYENAIEVLSNMNLDFDDYLEDNSEKYTSIKNELIFGCFDTQYKKYIEISDNKCCFVSDYFIEGVFSKKLFDIISLPKNIQKVENQKLYGYIINSNKSFYASNNTYASKSTVSLKDNDIKLISFNSNDISDINADTLRMVFKKSPETIKTKISQDNTKEEDIIEYISETLVT